MAAVYGETGNRLAGLPLLPLGPPTVSELEASVSDDGSFLVDCVEDTVENRRVVQEDAPRGVSDEVARAYTDGLPAPEFRLLDPNHEKIQMEFDARGLVDIKKLIQAVKATVSPEYEWTGHSDRHHVQWTKSAYEELSFNNPESRAVQFRELARNKLWVPRVFHNWLHVVTEPPPIPSVEVMHECIEEAAIINNFYHSVSAVMARLRLYQREQENRGGFDTLQLATRDGELGRMISGVLMHLEAAKGIPPERLPFNFDMRASTAAGQVGDLVMRGWQRKTKEVRRPSVKQVAA